MKRLDEWTMLDYLLAGTTLLAVLIVAQLVSILADLVSGEVIGYAHAAHAIARDMRDRLPPTADAPAKGAQQ